MSDPKTGGRPEDAEEPAFEEEPHPAEPAPVAKPQLQAEQAEPQQLSAALPPEQQVRIGEARALPPHAAAQGVANGGYFVDLPRIARGGRFKLAVASSVALTVVFLELLWLSPGVGIAFGVIVAPLMVYLIRITRTYMENESSFRRGMANTGSIVITILGSLLFMFVSFATIFWIICGNSHF